MAGPENIDRFVDPVKQDADYNMGIGLNNASDSNKFKNTFLNSNAQPVNESDPASNLSTGDFLPGEYLRETQAANSPILRGTYSGRVIGSVPIFAANVSSPVGNTTQREAALQSAAFEAAKLKQKAAEERRKKLMDFDPYGERTQIDDVAFNNNLQQQTTDEINSVLGKAQFQYGENWLDVVSTKTSKESQQLRKIQQNADIIAKMGNEVLTDMADIKSSGGDKMYSSYTKGLSEKLFARAGDFANSNPEDLIDLHGKLKGSMTVDKYINSNLSTQLKPVIQQYYNEAISQGKIGVKNITIETLPKEIYDRAYENIQDNMRLQENFYFTPEEEDQAIRRSLDNYLRTETKSTFQNLAGTGEDKEVKSIKNIKKNQPFTTRLSGATSNTSVTAAESLSHEPTKVTGTSSPDVIDASTGESLDVPGAFDMVLGETNIVPVTSRDITIGEQQIKKGTPVPDDYLSAAEKMGAMEYKVYSFGTAQIPNPDFEPGISGSKQFYEKRIYGPADRYASSLNDNGVPTDEFQNRADKLNNEIYLKSQGKPPEKSNAITSDEFNKRWAELKSGETLVGPDGVTYTKQ